MTEHNRPSDNLEPHVSDRFRKDLRDLFEPPGAVPARIDKTILDQAHQHLARPRRLIIRLRWAAGVAATAAVIVLGVILFNPQSESNNPKSIGPALAERGADIDGNGRVDILDAFRLARSIEVRGPAAPTRSGAAETQWDLNGDGRVDKDDVDLVAFAAVRLDPGLRGEGVLPLRREAILASLFLGHKAPATPDVQGQDALATNVSADPLDKGV